MPALSINATTLFYECVGSGPALLLIHGLGSSGDDWAFQREEFSRRHTLILPDLRGSGRSAKPPGPYSIAQFAADLWELLDALAIEMALMQPARVSRLVLCNALANYRTDTWRKWFEAHAQVALVRAIGLRRTARLVARRLFPHDDQAPKRQRVVDVLSANQRRTYLATIHALIGWSALDRLQALRAPTLVIAAEHDYTPLADKRAEMRHFPQAQLVVIAGSRHGTPFDATERFNASVLDFLGRPDAAVQTGTAANHQATSVPL